MTHTIIKSKLILILLSVLGVGIILFGYGQFLRFEHNAYGEASVVPGTYDWSLQVGNKTRTYRIHIPETFASSMPLVIVLHGVNSNGKQTEALTGFSELAKQKNFIVVYPNAQDNVWKVVEPALSEEEITFIEALIDELENKLGINTARVYVAGVSNGAQFAQLLGAKLSQKIAAIAPVAGTISQNNAQTLKPSRPIPVMYFHGTEDPVIPYNGVLPAQISAENMVKWWVEKNKDKPAPEIKELPDIVNDGTTVTRFKYQRATGEPLVIFYKINKGGHSWPGGPDLPETFGKTTHDINATELIWDFFAKYMVNNVFAEPFIVNGQVTLEGRTGIKDANPTVLQIRIKRPQEDNAIFRDDYVATTQDEQKNDNVYFFEIDLTGKLEPGNYDISVKEWHYLDVFKNIDLAQSENKIDFGELVVGDVNNDDIITSTDAKLTICFIRAGQECPIKGDLTLDSADLNNDAAVDEIDLDLGRLNMFQKGEACRELFIEDPNRRLYQQPIWMVGETKTLQWSTGETKGLTKLKVQYALDSSDAYHDLSSFIPNTGEYLWQASADFAEHTIYFKLITDQTFYYTISYLPDRDNLVFIHPKTQIPNYPTSENVLLVYNTFESQNPNFASHPEGWAIAQYYISRPGRDKAHLLGIKIPDSVRLNTYGEEIDRANYEMYIRDKIKEWLDENQDKDIRYIVLTKGIPLKITGDENSRSSVSSELSLLHSDYNKVYDSKTAMYTEIRNPYYYYNFEEDASIEGLQDLQYLFQANNFHNSKGLVINYLVTRLDGYSIDDVKKMIDRSVATDKSGNYYWVLDDCPIMAYPDDDPHSIECGKVQSEKPKVICPSAVADRMGSCDDVNVVYDEVGAKVLRGLGLEVIYENSKSSVYDASKPIIAYVGYGVHSGFPDDYITNNFEFDIANGALFSSYESLNAYGFHDKSQSTHGQLGEWISIGGTGGVGNVYEPYATAIANEAIWMPAYAVGYPLADAFYLSLPYLSWTQVVIGDPLTNTRPGKPSIILTKSALVNGQPASQATSGDIITYTITYKNIGEGEARNVVITDPIPDGTELAEILDNGALEGNTVRWTIASLPTKQGGSVRMRVKVK